MKIIIGSEFNLLQDYNFVSIENWVNLLNFPIFEFWAYYLELKIRVIFNIREFLTFVLVNKNWKLIQFLIIDSFWKLQKNWIELKIGQYSIFKKWKLKKLDLAVRYTERAFLFVYLTAQSIFSIFNF